MTTIPLILMTLAAAAASIFALRRLRLASLGTQDGLRHKGIQNALVAAIAVGSLGVLAIQWRANGGDWHPLRAHVDGLLLMGALFAGAIFFIQTRPKLMGLSAFALPLLTAVLAWGICSSMWTFHPFNMSTPEPAWQLFHTGSTYIGLSSYAVAAISGAMYLFVQRRLKHKTNIAAPGKLASLETLERIIIIAATIGFVLITLTLISGLVLVTRANGHGSLGASWWTSPKVWVATAAWAIYALLMNVRYASTFRGSRAAWLAIAGLVLLLITHIIVSALGAASDKSALIDTPRPCQTVTASSREVSSCAWL